MQNTFWTLIEDQYYRIHDGVLKYAPINIDTNNVDTSLEAIVEVISAQQLETINIRLGSHINMDNF